MSVKNLGGGALPRDAQGEPIPVALGITLKDGTGTPEVSPKTVSTEVEIIPPANAILLHILPTTDAVKFGTVTGLADFVVAPVDTEKVIACANGASIFIDKVTANSTMYFYFEHLNATNA